MTTFEDMRDRLRLLLADPDAAIWTDAELDRHLNAAQAEYCRRTRCLPKCLPLIKNEDGSYPWPDDFAALLAATDADTVLDSAGWRELARRLGPDFAGQTGDALYIFDGLSDADRFRLCPTPDQTAEAASFDQEEGAVVCGCGAAETAELVAEDNASRVLGGDFEVPGADGMWTAFGDASLSVDSGRLRIARGSQSSFGVAQGCSLDSQKHYRAKVGLAGDGAAGTVTVSVGGADESFTVTTQTAFHQFTLLFQYTGESYDPNQLLIECEAASPDASFSVYDISLVEYFPGPGNFTSRFALPEDFLTLREVYYDVYRYLPHYFYEGDLVCGLDEVTIDYYTQWSLEMSAEPGALVAVEGATFTREEGIVVALTEYDAAPLLHYARLPVAGLLEIRDPLAPVLLAAAACLEAETEMRNASKAAALRDLFDSRLARRVKSGSRAKRTRAATGQFF